MWGMPEFAEKLTAYAVVLSLLFFNRGFRGLQTILFDHEAPEVAYLTENCTGYRFVLPSLRSVAATRRSPILLRIFLPGLLRIGTSGMLLIGPLSLLLLLLRGGRLRGACRRNRVL